MGLGLGLRLGLGLEGSANLALRWMEHHVDLAHLRSREGLRRRPLHLVRVRVRVRLRVRVRVRV